MDVWFTSDSHFGHKNICGPSVSEWDKGYRDFNSVPEMNEALVDSLNLAKEDDLIIHGGDWSFGGKDNITKFRNQIRCKNIVLVFGNHDHHIKKEFRHLFTRTHDFLETYINGQFIVVSHYALRVWQKSHHGSWCLYGHSHGSLPDIGGKTFDMGWCTWRRLLHFDEVKEIMDKRSIELVDHHHGGTAQ